MPVYGQRLWAIVRTPNFKAWFGDWENDPASASKVVDENGEPLVVFHGTSGPEISAFAIPLRHAIGVGAEADGPVPKLFPRRDWKSTTVGHLCFPACRAASRGGAVRSRPESPARGGRPARTGPGLSAPPPLPDGARSSPRFPTGCPPRQNFPLTRRPEKSRVCPVFRHPLGQRRGISSVG